MLKKFLYTVILFVLAACASNPQPPSVGAGNIAAIDTLITREIEQNNIPGAVVRVQQGDSILHEKAYGFAQKYNYALQELDNPERMTTGHLFELASLTKVFATTFGIMMLVDRDEISLDDPIRTWLPAFDADAKKEITVRHLLSHSAGLSQWKPTYYYASNKEEQYDYISSLPLQWHVGEGRHYSDLGFMLLGRIIEEVSGRPLDQFMGDELYGPLDLEYTTFTPDTTTFENIAATSHGNPFERHMVYNDSFGYDVDVDPQSWDGWRTYTLHGQVNDGNAWYAAGGVAGHAGLFSNAADLQKMLTLLLQKGMYEGEQIISEAVIDTFLTKNEWSNGLGWAMDPGVISAEGAPAGTFGHTGFTGTNIVVIPASETSIILLTNRQHVGLPPAGSYYDLGPLRQQIVDEVLHTP